MKLLGGCWFRLIEVTPAPMSKLTLHDLTILGNVIQIGVAPNRIDVLTEIDGVAVRQPSGMSTNEPVEQGCPSCGAKLAQNAVLCVVCGFHTKLQQHLATSIERESGPRLTQDANPYAPPTVDDASELGSELTSAVVKQVEAIVFAAGTVRASAFFACLCFPVWFALLPWYAFQLWNWFRLRSLYEELREPNSFSPHVQLALQFQDARKHLVAGVAVGILFCGLTAMVIVSRFREVH